MLKKAKLRQKLIYLNTDVDKYLNFKKSSIINVLESQYSCLMDLLWLAGTLEI